jgi:5-methylthioadenosine/S-adenosylhomocysteine deaminase
MRLAVITQRQALNDPEVMGGLTPLRMAARNGARALNFRESGVLAPGYQADLIVIDGDQAHYQPIHSVPAALIWSTGPADVRDVMVAGRWLMRDRALLTLDEKTILAGFNRALEEMMSRPLGQFKTYDV